MKVAELTGALLDYWVVRAEGYTIRIIHFGKAEYTNNPAGNVWRWLDSFKPSTNWAQGGPFLESEAIGFHPISDAEWLAEEHITGHTGRGPTPLIAAMRAFVASKFGDNVPDEVQ